MGKLNIAELLKDCPKGTKLYSPIFGDVYLEKIRPHLAIVVTTDKKQGDFKEEFLYDGRYGINGVCMLFPSRDKTTWEGFQRPFKKEDVLVYDNPNKPSKDMEENDKAKAPNLKGEDYSGKRFGYKIPNGYEFDKIENGKIFLKPIKPTYPTTYEECYSILNDFNFPNPEKYDFAFDWRCKINDKDYGKLMQSFIKLFICRDAYWKIAGEEMGLGKHWEPNEASINAQYGIRPLLFPSKEIYNIFYDNFKDLIEQCKELL